MFDSASLWRKCVLALVVIAVLSTVGFCASFFAGGASEQHIVAVNSSGRQRMLSQRIAFLAQQYVNAADPAARSEATARLEEAVDLFRTSHRGLIHDDLTQGLQSEHSAELKALYFDPPTHLDRAVDRYATLVRTLLTGTAADERAALEEIGRQAGPLLEDLDRAVALFERAGREGVSWTRTIELIAWLSGLLVIALAVEIVIRPVHSEIDRRLRANQREIEEAAVTKRKFEDDNRQLWEAINSMRDGFVIYDQNDRLVMANRAFRDFHKTIADLIRPGASFEELVRAGLDRKMWDIGDQDPEDWLQEQLDARTGADEFETEVGLADGRRMVRHERRNARGEIIGTRIDVTEDRAREDELRSTEQQLERLAFFDELTGLPNRFHCQKDLAEKFVFAEAGDRFAVIHLDLDNFKRVNDTLGHAAGDRLLTDIGSRLIMLSAEVGCLKAYRWGGDEFIVTVSRTDEVDLDDICGELTDILAVPLTFNGAIMRPTVSLGIARYPEDGLDVDSLMVFADLALYATKEHGRDGYQFFTTAMKEKVDAEHWLEAELRSAISDGMLSQVYQPQVNIVDGSITGVEALIRWNHPDKGVISPVEFLPIAEATNLASPIGRFVFDEAMGAARRWLDAGISFGRVAINLSPQHLKSGSLVEDFLAAMHKHGIEPCHLTAEILESLLLDDPSSNKIGVIRQLHDLGVNIELDDFGTGYASLSHLSSLPIHGLKVDRSFINKILVDPKKHSVVKTLIDLARMLQIGVVCEGIETPGQMAMLRNLGQFSAQGYYIARPMGFDDITAWLEANRDGFRESGVNAVHAQQALLRAAV